MLIAHASNDRMSNDHMSNDHMSNDYMSNDHMSNDHMTFKQKLKQNNSWVDFVHPTVL